jgi:type IV pilus assembly protein PilO
MDIDVKDPRFIRWFVAVLLIIIVLPVYFMTSVLPFTYAARKAEIGRLEARHQELSRDLEKARLLVRNLERVEQEYQILHQQWQVAQTLLPEANEMPALLRKVTAAGQQSGVVFELFRPNPAINKGFYADNPVEVKVLGGYHQTGVFLSRLANLNRIVNVADLQLKGLEKQEDVPHTVETSMTLTAYTLGGGAPAEPQDAQQQLAAQGKQAQKPARKRPQASSH